MADKKLNNVSTLTSSTLASNDYAYVEDVSASNEQKKVTITDLAKVVGGLKYNGVVESGTLADLGPGLALCARSLYVPSDMYSTEFNNCCVVTIYFVDNVRLQICFSNNKFCYRRAWYSNTYADWQLVS